MINKEQNGDRRIKAAAKAFADKWLAKEGYEKGETQQFWNDLLGDVFGIERLSDYIEFEKRITLANGAKGFIDGYIPSVPVLIEQKGRHVDIRKAEKQSDGAMLDPHAQAKRYVQWLPRSQKPKYIIVCNFDEFLIYDEENPVAEPQSVKLCDLEKEIYLLDMLIDSESRHQQKEAEISVQAGDAVGKIYDMLLKQYDDPKNADSLRSLNMLCVRLVFCLYAEDSGIFGHLQFGKYLSQYKAAKIRRALIDLFETLNTPENERDKYLDDDLKAFPYVNGGLFADNKIEIPNFTDDLLKFIVDNVSAGIDWSDISPTIFGAVFESTLNPETRRSGGMHYTSVRNIHKVIDPLFLDELNAEYTKIYDYKESGTRHNAFNAFHKKISELTFLDPACGSGNFLTETYLSLRKLENKVISELYGAEQGYMDGLSPVLVDISQFYGIEINDFAVSVAKTALWIAEHQMLRKTEEILGKHIPFLPLKTYANIVEGNALRMDWNDVVPKDNLNYIMGNPPFVGYSLQTNEQKADILSVYVDEKGKPYKTAGKIDYVSAWYFKAAQLMQNTDIRTAFVSTNSITQGEQVAAVWKPLYDRFGIHIDFAHRTFKWNSEAADKAQVHVVIVGYSFTDNKTDKHLYDNDNVINAEKINPYLVNADTIFIESHKNPICNVPEMMGGGKPADNGNLILSIEEKIELLRKEPQAEPLIRPFMMGKDFIDRKPRYCLWLVNANPALLRKCPLVMERVEKVKQFRLASKKAATNKKAETPTLFDEIKDSKTDYIALPVVSSENRKYIPIDYLSKEVIAGNKLFEMPNATIYHFGILTSSVHMAWMRAVCGRLKSDYSYSNTIVYNNFPWCTPTPEQKAKIEQTAQGILEARALYPDCSLADLYDETTMPPELRKAHKANDKAVMQAYGFKPDMTESEIVAELMKMYQELTEGVGK